MITRPSLRRSMSRAIASAIRFRHGVGSWAPVGAQYAHVASTLREKGIATLPELVSEGLATNILAYFQTKDVVGRDGRLVQLGGLPPDTSMAAYPLRTILESSDVLNLINSAPVLRMAADYLGCIPTLSSLGVRWSFPVSRPPAATQLFHRDPDDWKFVKLFVYLTDVDAGSGPHAYVTYSFLTAGKIRARTYSRQAIDSRYSKDAVYTVTGPRGTAFMADTYGIHAGAPPTHTPRLMLQAQYSLLPIFAFNYCPVVLNESNSLASYVNRLLIALPR